MEKSTIVQTPDIKIDELTSKFAGFKKLCIDMDNYPLMSYDLFIEIGQDLCGVGPAKMIDKLAAKNIKIYNYDTSQKEIIKEDFAGFYMFYKNGKPKYCGISRNVLKRVADHTKGDKQSATLAHRLTMSESLNNNSGIN